MFLFVDILHNTYNVFELHKNEWHQMTLNNVQCYLH